MVVLPFSIEYDLNCAALGDGASLSPKAFFTAEINKGGAG